MAVVSAPIHYEYHIAVGRQREPRLLLLPGEGGWRLPAFSEGQGYFWQEIGHVTGWLRESLGASATALRCLAMHYQPTHELVSKVYAAVLHDPAWAPPQGAYWVAAEELPALPLDVEAHRGLIADWFAWYGGGVTPRLRAPWYMPGWYDEAIAWAIAQLERVGQRATGPARQLRSWQRAALLRLPTTAGVVYLKAVPPVFGHEPALTAALAAADPSHFAHPIAIDPDRGWLLMRELPGPSLATFHEEVAVWEAALGSFAEVQITTTRRLAELRALGVPVRSLTTLAARLAPLLADTNATLPGSPAGLSDRDRAQLRALVPRLHRLRDDLAGFGLPAALEHGDFWAGQVIVGPRQFGFLDWANSSITHPFFSLLLFLVEVEDFLPHVPAVRERLRDAYLEPWGAIVRGVNLVRAFELAQPLAALHHALIYHAVVLPQIEVKWELELMLPFYLKMALRLAG